MPHFHCTVEYRIETGVIRHYTTDLEAETGDDAALMAEMALIETEPGITGSSDVVIAKVVCLPAGAMDEPPHPQA